MPADPPSIDHFWRSAAHAPALDTGSIHVWRLLAENQPPPALAEALLSGEERGRAAQFLFEKDRVPWIATRAVLRLLLGDYTAAAAQEVLLSTDSRGKPAVSGSDLQFNVSHTTGVAVFAFARGITLGIDVERVRPASDLDDVARQNFSPREQQQLAQVAPGDRTESFYRCWTRKEAVLKAEGSGLTRPLDSFAVSLAPDEPAQVLEGAPGWSLAHLAVGCNALGALAWAEQANAPAIELLDWSPQLLR